MKQRFALAIHGGAGTLVRGMMTPRKEKKYKAELKSALSRGYKILQNNGTSVDACEAAVAYLEDSTLFNAGKGSVFTAKGIHEMDAAIMDGSNLNCGAVSLVTGIKNPIKLSKDIMLNSEHIFLAAEGALEFARLHGHKELETSYFFDQLRFEQWQELKNTSKFQLDHSRKKDEKFGTVGAVACDASGNLAAATSTGGMTNKYFGRVGDSPIIGAGTYANNLTCAISCTGSGEYFMKGVVAYDVSCLMEYRNLVLEEACAMVIHEKLPAIGGDGGLIAIDRSCNIAMPFNTEGMYRASRNSLGKTYIEIYSD